MANLVISGAGAVAGYLVGGPTGAQIGWMLGSSVAAGRETIDQRTVGDLRVTTSEYGAPIPYTFGKQRVSGNIIWAQEKKPYDIKTKSGSKGGGPTTVTTGYTVSFAIAICAGPILGISRVWNAEKLIVDSSTVATPLPGILYLGDLTQMPDPTMESDKGSGNVPAYRGIAYMVFKDFDLGTSGVMPQLSFEVCRGATV